MAWPWHHSGNIVRVSLCNGTRAKGGIILPLSTGKGGKGEG